MGSKFFYSTLEGGVNFFACVEAASTSSAHNRELFLQAFNEYSDTIYFDIKHLRYFIYYSKDNKAVY